MEDRHDFSKGEQGEFYRAFRLPVNVEEDVQSCLAAKADACGIEVSELVNQLDTKDIEPIESRKEALVSAPCLLLQRYRVQPLRRIQPRWGSGANGPTLIDRKSVV